MNQRTRIPRRSRRTMVPSLDQLEGRQLLSNFSTVPSPAAPNATLTATAAIADNDIWAVGYDDVQVAPPAFNTTLAEHFDGTTWSVVPTPSLPSGGVNSPQAEFLGVAAVASNDVWAVGFKTGPDNPDFG